MGFEDLDVWKVAIEFVKDAYRLTRAFPDEERFGLVSQIKRAAVSIPSNIAEGSGRKTGKDFDHFLSIAFGSVNELITLLIVAEEQGFLNEDDFKHLREQLKRISQMLSRLSNSIQQ